MHSMWVRFPDMEQCGEGTGIDLRVANEELPAHSSFLQHLSCKDYEEVGKQFKGHLV